MMTAAIWYVFHLSWAELHYFAHMHSSAYYSAYAFFGILLVTFRIQRSFLSVSRFLLLNVFFHSINYLWTHLHVWCACNLSLSIPSDDRKTTGCSSWPPAALCRRAPDRHPVRLAIFLANVIERRRPRRITANRLMTAERFAPNVVNNTWN